MSESTFPTALRLPSLKDLDQKIIENVIAKLQNWLRRGKPGLCGRLDDLSFSIMAEVAEKLFNELDKGFGATANIRILVPDRSSTAWECHWTEAVRLRNLDENGNKRPPFILFVPPGTELLGSLDTDTFTAIPCENIVRDIISAQLNALPDNLRPVAELLRRRDMIKGTSDIRRALYLLSISENNYSLEAAGLSLFYLGLWPHKDWLNSGDQRDFWISRNRDVTDRLRNGVVSLLDRIYALKLNSPTQARKLFDLLFDTESVDGAAAKVAGNPSWEDLDFGMWNFESLPSTVIIKIDPIDLPRHEDGYPVLRLQEQSFLPLSWTIEPGPSQVSDLTHYLVELITTTTDAIEVAHTSEAITAGKVAHKSYKLKNIEPLVVSEVLPEGLYRARVTAWSQGTNITRQNDSSGDETNISSYFWVKRSEEGSDEPEPPQQQKDRLVSSYMDARREIQWNLLDNSLDPWALPDCAFIWDGTTESRAVQNTCLLKIGKQSFRIKLSIFLRKAETTILANPECLGALRADLSRSSLTADVSVTQRTDILRLAEGDKFLKARTDLFLKIRGLDGRGIVETCDLLALRSDIINYVKEYISLLSDAEQDVSKDPKRWQDRVGLASIDTVRITLKGLSDQTSVAILLAPTHPLRLLWYLQLSLLGDAWLREAQTRNAKQAFTPEIKQAFRDGLQPINLPPILFDRRRVGYLRTGSIAPSWDLYLPADISDKQSAVSRLSHALGYNNRQSSKTVDVDGVVKITEQYLKQHPYIGQLCLNVFNPGDGAIIVDLLEKLDVIHPNLRYDIRLFALDPLRDDLGSALDQLVNPDVTIGEAAEKYSQSSEFQLYPYLTYSKNRTSEFLNDPRQYQAHISILLDIFRPGVVVAEPFAQSGISSLNGLVQEEITRCQGEQGVYAWERQVIPVAGNEINVDNLEANLIALALSATQSFLAALGASPSAMRNQLPTARLDLTIDGQNLLYEIHRISDWVLTSDRYLGIDYFDSASSGTKYGAPGILLDFTPEFPMGDHPILMLTTRIDKEVNELVAPILQRLGLDHPGCGVRVIEWLRSLSGRLAIRLLADPILAEGIIGMALARAFLGRINMLKDTLIIPVDAHVDLLKSGRMADESEERTDLILARRVGDTHQIEFTLVEVKFRGGSLSPAAYAATRQGMELQITRTQSALASIFVPNLGSPDRIERPLRNLFLSNWLRFYAARSHRYGLLSSEAETNMMELLSALDHGFTLSFRQAGFIFELGREDDLDDVNGEFRIHRIGRRSIERLLQGEDDKLPDPPVWDRVRDTFLDTSVWIRSTTVDTSISLPVSESKDSSEPNEPVAIIDTDPSISVSQDRTALDKITTDQSGRSITDTINNKQETKNPEYHYLIGDTKPTPQWGVIGKVGSDSVALDLNGCNTLSIFGVQGGGKSYTMGTILEMAIKHLPGINVLPSPLASVVFHYNESQDYPPEFVSMTQSNRVNSEIIRLKEEYNATPTSLDDILVLTPEDKVQIRKKEFPGVSVESIAFHPAELTIQDWRFLMGAVGNDSLYIKELNLIMRSLRDHITVEGFKQGIEGSQLSESQRKLALLRLRFAEQFVRDGDRLRDKLYPGRLIIVDLRDELIETDEALGLFVVMLRVFAGATYNGRPFNKLIAFDEAHKYIRNSDLVDSVVEVIRQMRHQATSVIIASQDPPSLPLKIMELSSMVMLHRMDSPQWLKYIQRAITALGDLTAPALARLRPGEAYLWARTATDPMFTHRAVKIQCRPRVTQHGGATKEAVEEGKG